MRRVERSRTLAASTGHSDYRPTTSFGAIVLVLLLGTGLVAFLCKGAETAYILLSLVGLLMSALAIYGGFTKDSSNWPSEFWRWAGITVNAVGVLGFVLALGTFHSQKISRKLITHP
jgi:ABC-type multidrug transport system permease subunit